MNPWNTKKLTRVGMVVVAGALAVGMSACSGSTTASSNNSSAPAAPATSAAAAAPVGENFGSGCASVPKTGAGSFQGMSGASVANAASANPVLSTLVAAVKQAGLVDTLNSLPAATVFAPPNAAFAKIPADQLKKVLADKATLTKILTYHVVAGKKLTPEQVIGTQTTVEKGTLTVAGSGEDLTVNGNAKIVCGNVQTANATVYIVDTVLMPPA
ncbi:fasciclin domain-containing protein [Fodinicola feengrottensis]|uniref:fasciclin domain-containing protein n=1 Tax=Fodinicola feengrottensis TaxID=435914 RepID=UPI0028BDEE59|nr:fasciclin domain-containing protein [Fodinicola feengrottensis]